MEHVLTDNIINQAMEYHFIGSKTKHPKPGRVPICIKWCPPTINSFKLNTDGATHADGGKGGLGRLFRDHNRKWLKGYSKTCSLMSIVQDELLAMRSSIGLGSPKGTTYYPWKLTLIANKTSKDHTADMLAKEGAKAPTFELIEKLEPPPPAYVSSILESDVIGIGSIRRIPMNNVLVNGQMMARNEITYSNWSMPPTPV
ncbi:hypothetical protein H5410_056082 [Solanum commersonii]|uniref:Uncharacterized protein n=1 Tax=Solanum commersonii TaxID=4109 RepID=A0A9J5WL84_SOLCO|nr:hypothetical protein H5410_056082 [Solanum commersonii]